MIETLMDKIKGTAMKSMKRIGDQRRRFQEIVYGKGMETFSRMNLRANKTKDKINQMRDSILKKH
ncbi:uncharacterized protein Dvar_57570 [Desulfosarcina variabilis str. Montpellier]|uniref:hypothetical protein n=1 Tax=Desulfosarcina variabilis TaxID=2300 RepID=UPI003AFAC307